MTHDQPKSKTSSPLLFALCASALIGGIACKKPAADETGATSQALAAEPPPGQAGNPSSVNPANPTPVDVPAGGALPADPAAGVAAGAGSGAAGIAPTAPAAPTTDAPATPPGTGTEKGLVGTPPKAEDPKTTPPKTEPPKTTPPKDDKKSLLPEPPKAEPKPTDPPKTEPPKTTPPKADEETPEAKRKVRDRKGVSAKRLPGSQN